MCFRSLEKHRLTPLPRDLLIAIPILGLVDIRLLVRVLDVAPEEADDELPLATCPLFALFLSLWIDLETRDCSKRAAFILPRVFTTLGCNSRLVCDLFVGAIVNSSANICGPSILPADQMEICG
jgi:hypothetical protein